MTRATRALRPGVSAALVWACIGSTLFAQQTASIEPVRPSANVFIRPYLAPDVPPVRLANSTRIGALIRGGILYLTAQDAIALALENNIDVEIARYNPIIAAWQLERAEAGGALPGVPSNAAQAGQVAAGQGVQGSRSAAGVSVAGANANTSRNTNASISQIGPVTQTLDPIFQESSTYSHTSIPQPNLVQLSSPNLISNTRAYNVSLQQGTLSGGSVSLTYTENYLNENAATDLLNPSVAPNLSIGIQHNLLRGFGIAVNSRTITVSRMNLNTTDLNFRNQVIGIVARVLNAYYALAADYDDVKAKRNAADVARTFLNNVREQVRLGSSAEIDIIQAESQDVTSRQAIVDSEAALRQQEITLKNLISRNGTADAQLRTARIMPVDRITIPDKEDLPPVDEMVRQALANRADLAVVVQNERAAEISNLGTRNGVLPSLQVFGGESNAGLAGVGRTVPSINGPQTPDPYFVGDIGTALGQVFRRNFPSERIGAFYFGTIRNRAAQADYAIDQLQYRQTQLSTRKNLNQVQVDILNYVTALQQTRARYDAAVHNRILQQGLFEAEQKRFTMGASTPFNVVRQQRDLVNAQSAETTALTSYSTARVALDQALGTTLESNHVTIGEARTGVIASQPAALPPGQ